MNLQFRQATSLVGIVIGLVGFAVLAWARVPSAYLALAGAFAGAVLLVSARADAAPHAARLNLRAYLVLGYLCTISLTLVTYFNTDAALWAGLFAAVATISFLLPFNSSISKAWPLLGLCLVALALRIALYQSSPFFFGNDSFAHFGWVQAIVEAGHVPISGDIGKFSKVAAMHTFLGMIDLVAGGLGFDLPFFALSLPQIGLFLMAFVLARRLVGGRSAIWIIAVLIADVSLIERSHSPTPGSLVLLLAYPVLWAWASPHWGRREALIALVPLACAILAHQLSTAALFLVLALISGVTVAARAKVRPGYSVSLLGSAFLCFVFFNAFVVSSSSQPVFLASFIKQLIGSFSENEVLGATSVIVPTFRDVILIAFASTSIVILRGYWLAGTIRGVAQPWWLRPLAFAMLIAWALRYALPFLGITTLYTERWEAIFALPSALIIAALAWNVRSSNIISLRHVTIGIAVGFLLISNATNPGGLVGPERPGAGESFGATDLTASRFAMLQNGDIASDYEMANGLLRLDLDATQRKYLEGDSFSLPAQWDLGVVIWREPDSRPNLLSSSPHSGRPIAGNEALAVEVWETEQRVYDSPILVIKPEK